MSFVKLQTVTAPRLIYLFTRNVRNCKSCSSYAGQKPLVWQQATKKEKRRKTTGNDLYRHHKSHFDGRLWEEACAVLSSLEQHREESLSTSEIWIDGSRENNRNDTLQLQRDVFQSTSRNGKKTFKERLKVHSNGGYDRNIKT